MRNFTRPPRTYELMTILAPEVPEDQISPMIDQIQGYITDAGGTIVEVLQDQPWGRRRLAYPIRHNGHDVRDGYYTVFHFDLEPGRVAEIEREVLLNNEIIRFLVTVYTAPPPSLADDEGIAEDADEQSVDDIEGDDDDVVAASDSDVEIEADVDSEATQAADTADNDNAADTDQSEAADEN